MGYLFDKVQNNYLFPINKTVDAVQKLTGGLTCLASSLFGAGAGLNASSIMAGLAGVAAGLAGAILSTVQSVIMRRVYQMVNSVLSPIRQIRGIINDLTKILVSTKKTYDKASTLNNYLKDRQNCAVTGASLLNCIAQNAINKITDKIAMNIDKHLGPIANSVTKEAMDVNGTISKNLKRHTEFLDKGKLQNKLLG